MYYKEEHAFKRFQKAIKDNKIPGIILLSGSEQFLVDWARNILVDKYTEKSSRPLDFISVDEQELGGIGLVNYIIESCETPPILSERKIILVKNPKMLEAKGKNETKENELKELVKYFEDLPDTTLLIFTGEKVDKKLRVPKAIGKLGAIYDFGPLERPDLISFASKRFRDAGIHVSERAMESILEHTGYFNKESDYNLYSFSNDIVKMIALSEGGELTEEIVKETISGDEETYIFTLLDSIASRDRETAYRLLHNIATSSSEGVRVANMLISHFETMYSIKEYQINRIPDRIIVDKTGINEYRLKRMKMFAERFSVEKLRSILSSAYEIERNIKMGIIDYRMALELFVTKI